MTISARTPWAFNRAQTSRASGKGVWKSPNSIRVVVLIRDGEYHQPCPPAQSRGCSFALDEDGVLDVEVSGARGRVVVLVVNEDEQGVAETIDLLPGAAERTGRLWLANARYLDVYAKLRKVDTLGRRPTDVRIAALQMGLKLVLQVGADGFPIRHPKKAGFVVLGFLFRKGGSLLVKQGDCQGFVHKTTSDCIDRDLGYLSNYRKSFVEVLLALGTMARWRISFHESRMGGGMLPCAKSQASLRMVGHQPRQDHGHFHRLLIIEPWVQSRSVVAA